MIGVRVRLAMAVLPLFTAGCASNRYVRKNGGAPVYEVQFVHQCSAYSGRVWIDDEYNNRHKIDVKARFMGSRPLKLKLPGGPHTFHAEFREPANIQVQTGSFVVREAGATFRMCASSRP